MVHPHHLASCQAALAQPTHNVAMAIKDLRISSPDFETDGRIPDRFTAYHDNETPTLEISGVPEGAAELAVVCHDPDAPRPRGFNHWTVYGIPADTTRMGPDVSRFREGPTDAGGPGWYGPKPPQGHGTHRYYFWVYALNAEVEDAPTREDFLLRYAGNILEQNRVVGTYSA
jgi:Raf kinase inhibitor-like YbhB/YbcL family protein